MSEWIFNKPISSKRTDHTNKEVSVFTFTITGYRPYSETFTATIDQLQKFVFTPALLSSYMLDMYGAFLKAHSSKFAKSYTPAQLIKVTKNSIKAQESPTTVCDWSFIPVSIDILGNTFILNWMAIPEPKIQLEDDSDELEEIDVDRMMPAASDDDFLRLNSPEKLHDIKKLQRAQLRVKLSQLRLEKAIARYISRYGDIEDDLLETDSSDEETDYESDDQ